jgi:hypothetical protein
MTAQEPRLRLSDRHFVLRSTIRLSPTIAIDRQTTAFDDQRRLVIVARIELHERPPGHTCMDEDALVIEGDRLPINVYRWR